MRTVAGAGAQIAGTMHGVSPAFLLSSQYLGWPWEGGKPGDLRHMGVNLHRVC